MKNDKIFPYLQANSKNDYVVDTEENIALHIIVCFGIVMVDLPFAVGLLEQLSVSPWETSEALLGLNPLLSAISVL